MPLLLRRRRHVVPYAHVFFITTWKYGPFNMRAFNSKSNYCSLKYVSKDNSACKIVALQNISTL